jgi:hypothetical protein
VWCVREVSIKWIQRKVIEAVSGKEHNVICHDVICVRCGANVRRGEQEGNHMGTQGGKHSSDQAQAKNAMLSACVVLTRGEVRREVQPVA